MSLTGINLDGWDALEDTGVDAGKPLQLDITIVHEDPNQPRTNFDLKTHDELTASIKATGVKSPISVRVHPDLVGHYMINFGARRLRACKEAGLVTIPAFIDSLHTDYDQVVENLQRADLTPMEMALFIASKIKGGDKPAEVARKLGIGKEVVSKYMALAEAPTEIEDVYSSGRCQSPVALYALSRVLAKWPEETRAWLQDDVEVTRRSIDAFANSLNALPLSEPVGKTVNPDLTKKATAVIKQRFKCPILLVTLGARVGKLILSKAASRDDLVFVEWADAQEIGEVEVTRLQILKVIEQ